MITMDGTVHGSTDTAACIGDTTILDGTPHGLTDFTTHIIIMDTTDGMTPGLIHGTMVPTIAGTIDIIGDILITTMEEVMFTQEHIMVDILTLVQAMYLLPGITVSHGHKEVEELQPPHMAHSEAGLSVLGPRLVCQVAEEPLLLHAHVSHAAIPVHQDLVAAGQALLPAAHTAPHHQVLLRLAPIPEVAAPAVAVHSAVAEAVAVEDSAAAAADALAAVAAADSEAADSLFTKAFHDFV